MWTKLGYELESILENKKGKNGASYIIIYQKQ